MAGPPYPSNTANIENPVILFKEIVTKSYWSLGQPCRIADISLF